MNIFVRHEADISFDDVFRYLSFRDGSKLRIKIQGILILDVVLFVFLTIWVDVQIDEGWNHKEFTNSSLSCTEDCVVDASGIDCRVASGDKNFYVFKE